MATPPPPRPTGRDPTTLLADSKAFFGTHPYTAPLLSSCPPSTHTALLPPTFHPKPSGEDALYALTLSTPTTFTHALTLHPNAAPAVARTTTLVALGSDMDGWPGVLHGGIIATLIDECMGVTQQIDVRAKIEAGGREGDDKVRGGGGAYTTRLDVRYLAPVKTPGVVKVEVEVTERKGRWVRLKAEVRQGDGKAADVLCSTGVAEFVALKAGPAKL